MAVYTYDGEADALYITLVDEEEALIERTEELGPNLHVDLDSSGRVIGVEFLYPSTHGLDPEPVKRRYGIQIDIPFTFAA